MSAYPGQPSQHSAFFSGEDSRNLAQLSDEEFWRHARELAHLPPPSPPEREYLRCAFVEGSYILPLAALRAVDLLPRHLTFLPSSPPWMLGLTSWHDEPIAIVDLSAYLLHAHAQFDPNASLLIAQNDYITLGLSTVVISSIPSLQAAAIQPLEPSSMELTPFPSGIIGLYENAFVLDIPSLLMAIAQDITMAKVYE